MRVLTIAILAAALTGCSSFKLGSMFYCPAGEACSMQKFPPAQQESDKSKVQQEVSASRKGTQPPNCTTNPKACA